MNRPGIDIIVPVWNKPEETRHCLAELAEHTPEARFILMNNASDRETEILLQEFAEVLGERALLCHNDKTCEFVALVNSGLARAEAPVIALVKNTTTVREGWLEPMLELISHRPDAGLIVPEFIAKKNKIPAGKKVVPSLPVEIPHSNFAAVLIRKELYERIGGFDEGMDGGLWCMKDYSRRAWKEGFVTIGVTGASVFHEEGVPLGSPARLEQRVKRSIATYISRWGKDRSYCVDMSMDVDPDGMGRKFGMLLGSARCGHSFTVLAPPKTYREIVKSGYHLLHKNIAVQRLPSLFASAAVDKVFARLCKDTPEISMITHADELFWAGMDENMADSDCFLTGGPDAE